jgi:hypothetical protein
MAKKELFCEKRPWRDREAYLLGNDKVRLVVLTGGGHIAEFRFAESTGLPTMNPLWVPPWKTIEPYEYREKVHTKRYGPPGIGRLLGGISGHNLCLDHYGPPSDEEAAQGLSTHGEAGVSKWRKKRMTTGARSISLSLEVSLPIAGLSFEREIRLREGESVVYYKETVTNMRKADHRFDWQQHVTFGPPFLSRENSRFLLSGTKGLIHPGRYEGKELLKPGVKFTWPKAPSVDGERVDLRRSLSRDGCGFIVTVLMDRQTDAQYMAAYNVRQRLLIGYLFHRRDFAWTTIWEENRARKYPPWRGKSVARGMEFGTTPLPLTPREALSLGRPFGVPSCAIVPARGKRVVTYTSFLAALPKGFNKVVDIKAGNGLIEILGMAGHGPVNLVVSGATDGDSTLSGV